MHILGRRFSSKGCNTGKGKKDLGRSVGIYGRGVERMQDLSTMPNQKMRNNVLF